MREILLRDPNLTFTLSIDHSRWARLSKVQSNKVDNSDDNLNDAYKDSVNATAQLEKDCIYSENKWRIIQHREKQMLQLQEKESFFDFYNWQRKNKMLKRNKYFQLERETIQKMQLILKLSGKEIKSMLDSEATCRIIRNCKMERFIQKKETSINISL